MPAWFGEGVIEPKAGGAVTLMGGHIKGGCHPMGPAHKLAHSWNVFGPGEVKSSYPESYLTLSLAPRGDQVFLILNHLPVLERFEKQNAMGWHTYLDMLTEALRGEASQPRKTHMDRNAGLHGVDLNNLAR